MLLAILKRLITRIGVKPVIGNDLVFVPDVAASHHQFGDRYLKFIFTTNEIQDCMHEDGSYSYASLAARIAAKESVMKLLKPARDQLLPWQSIEVRRDPTGAAHLFLHAAAKSMAKKKNIDAISLSLAHENQYASAFVLANHI